MWYPHFLLNAIADAPCALSHALQHDCAMQTEKTVQKGQTTGIAKPFGAGPANADSTMHCISNNSLIKQGAVKEVPSAKKASRIKTPLKGKDNCKPDTGELPCCFLYCICSLAQVTRQASVTSLCCKPLSQAYFWVHCLAVSTFADHGHGCTCRVSISTSAATVVSQHNTLASNDPEGPSVIFAEQ